MVIFPCYDVNCGTDFALTLNRIIKQSSMALLRPVKKGETHNTSWELTEYLPTDVCIKEEERYKVAKRMFDADNDIVYIYYWCDLDEKARSYESFTITRKDADYMDLHPLSY